MAQRKRAAPASPSGSPQPEARAGGAQAEALITTLVTTRVGDETVTYYANFVEIAALQHDFAMLFGRLPAKLPPDKQEEAKAGTVTLTSDVQIFIPATLIDGLMRALATAKAIYEQRYGITLHEPGGSDAESGGR